MNKIIIIGQCIGFIGLFFSLRSFVQKDKDKYAKNAIIAATINCVHYLLLRASSGVFTKALAAIREVLVYKKAKNKEKLSIFWFYLILSVYVAIIFVLYPISTLSEYGILNLFPIFAAILYFIAEWFGNTHAIRIVAFITTLLWLVYNIIVLSISGIIYNIVGLTTLAIVLAKDKINKKSRKK